MTLPSLATISIYPIKSLRGHELDISIVERMGLEDDRRFMVVDPQGKFLTQREHARMALLNPVLNSGMISITAAGMQTLSIEIRKSGKRMDVEIWSSPAVELTDQGDLAADWLSEFLKMSARLVRISDGYQRKVDPTFSLLPDDHVGFADGFPILIVAQESLDDLNSRLKEPVLMNRFRPNLVVKGVPPFAEDTWKRIRIGSTEMALVKPCARCNVPNIKQETAEIVKEPNATLAKYRKKNGKVFFGVNVIPITTGRIQVGDPLEILD